VFVAGTVTVGTAQAGCIDLSGSSSEGGAAPLLPAPEPTLAAPGLLRTALRSVSDEEHEGHARAGIVGLWRVTFVAKGNAAGPPDGVVLDNALVTWHADGTELMNSSRAPRTQSYCMGVWKRTGHDSYRLNHWALSWSDDGNMPVGPANIREEVTLGPGGNSYTGTFDIRQYNADESVVLGHVTGVIAATRITP
jgi:hypothetical protein